MKSLLHAAVECPVRRISPAETLHRNTLLVDVRTAAEYEDAHIEGSVSHPLSELDAEWVSKLAANKDDCTLVCKGGTRAQKAAVKLTAARLTSVCVLDGGVTAWEAAGLPLVHGQATMSLERQVRITAGTVVLTGAVLGYFYRPVWIALSGFVGAGLIVAGLTNTCGMGTLIGRLPWNNRRSDSSAPPRRENP
ncbi:rhodanese-like domain-containing protein [soil metagenome]